MSKEQAEVIEALLDWGNVPAVISYLLDGADMFGYYDEASRLGKYKLFKRDSLAVAVINIDGGTLYFNYSIVPNEFYQRLIKVDLVVKSFKIECVTLFMKNSYISEIIKDLEWQNNIT